MQANTRPPVKFDELLFEFRQRQQLSQSKLAQIAGLDHSYVSRLESGVRMPTPSTVVRLAEALELYGTDEDRLLMAAGFMPLNFRIIHVSDDPILMEIFDFLQDDRQPEQYRNMVVSAIQTVVQLTRAHKHLSGAVVQSLGSVAD